MSNPLSGLKIEHWWQAFTVTGVVGMVACFAVRFDFIPQRDAFLIFLGMFLFGVGQWINHPIQCGYYDDGRISYTTKGYHRKSMFLGVCLELLGGMIFVIEIFKVLFSK